MKNSLVQKITYLNGKRFQRGVIAGVYHLIQNHEYLNAINVFPVADGDTGSNMAGTMKSLIFSSHIKDFSISNVTKEMSDSILIAARGNSGAILAQFMCGFSEKVQGLSKLSPSDFISAVVYAAKRAKEAMSNPQDGTILSVIQDWVEHLKKNAHCYSDFIDLLEDSIDRARISLHETREKLAVLKSAGVVDAGAQGFIYLLEGILDFTHKGSINKNFDEILFKSKASTAVNSEIINNMGLEHVIEQEITFIYCVECLLEDIKGNKQILKKQLEAIGDSLIVVGSEKLLRIHVHTNNPEKVFSLAEAYGLILQRKIENMQEQHSELFHNVIFDEVRSASLNKQVQQVGIVTDSTCDLPQEKLDQLGIHVVPLRIFLDEKEYIDKVNLSTKAFNARLLTSRSAKTSQPAPFDFQQAYEGQLHTYGNVLSLHVMNLYSGSFQSAVAMSKHFDNRVHVIDSYTLTAGLGLLVSSAVTYAQTGASLDEIIKFVYKDRENIRVFVSMDTLEFAVRGGRISKGSGAIANFLGIKPILEFSTKQQGRVTIVAKAIGRKRSQEVLLKKVISEAEKMKNVRFAIAHVGALKTAEQYAEMLYSMYNVEVEYIMDASASLSVHGGPGACAICFLGESD